LNRVEQFLFALLSLGFIMVFLGLALYVNKILVKFGVDWELQLATIGVFIVLLTLVVAKVLSRD